VDRYPIQMAGTSPGVEAVVAAVLGQVQGIRSFSEWGAARESLATARPGVAVVGLPEHAGPEPFELVRELAAHGTPVVVQAPRKDADAILASMRAGAREFFVVGEERKVAHAVQSLLESAGELRLAGVTAVLPAKGGVGATVIAAHLAGAFQRRGGRVCLADLDLELGDARTFLDMSGSYSLTDVAANARRLDRELLDSSVPRHSSGIWVLSQSEKVSEADRLGAEGTAQVIRFLRHHYDQIVLDGLGDFGDVTLAALDLADRLLLVLTQEVLAVRDAQRAVGILRQLGQDLGRVDVVVNRYQKRSNITVAVIQETLGLPVRATIGNDFQALSRAVNRGVLVWDESATSVVGRDMDAYAEAQGGAGAAPPASFLSRFFGGKRAANGAR